MPSSFDVIVIGSGAGGFSAVEAARSVGATTCLMEKDALGGECPNWACVPSKALLRAAKAYRALREAQTFGLTAGGVVFDWKKVMDYRRKAVEAVTGGSKGERYVRDLRRLGVHVEMGEATFVDMHAVEVGGKRLSAKAFVIATGSVECVPPIAGLEGYPFLTSRDALQLERHPKTMGIIGGGPVGCELATLYASFGTRVVLLQKQARVLPREDHEIAAAATESLASLGVEVVTQADVREVINARGGVYGLKVETQGSVTTHAVECVVLAAGKRSRTEGLNLTEVGVRLDERGSIVTGTDQRTTARGVYAAGDVDGGLLFTHTAHHEGVVAGRNAALFALGKRTPVAKRGERVVPRVTFLSPEVASVGMTSEEAKKRFKKVLVGQCLLATLGRAVTDHAPAGLVKIVAHPTSRKVLGCHIIGERAGEMIHEAALAMHLSATVDKIASMIHAYPTWSEGLVVAAASVRRE